MEHKLDPHTRLSGRWLMLARVVWIVIAAIAVGMFVVGAPHGLAAYTQGGAFATAELMEALQAQGLSPQLFATVMVVSILISGFIWVSVGALIFIRKRDSWMALLASLALVTFGTQTMLRGALAQALPAFAWPQYLLTVISWTAIALFFSLFPNGRFVPRWIRWFVLGWLALIALPQLIANVIANMLPGIVVGLVFAAFWAGFLSAQIYRYFRVSTPIERQQTKWVLFGFAVFLAFYMPLFALFLSNSELINSPYLLVLGNFSPVVIPLSIGVALLRSRLWDIDILIRRTLQYSLLSGLLALAYFGLVIVLQSLFTAITGQQQNDFVTVLSTLAIAGLFAPLRRRVQDWIDRRFYRKKYDAAKTLAEFGATCRDETDLDKLTARLVEVVQETMQPQSVTLWLKPTADRRPPTVDGRSVEE